MTDYHHPSRGQWVTFHPNEPGLAQVGEVTDEKPPNKWGRARFRIRYQREVTRGKRQVPEPVHDIVSADRIIAIVPKPPRPHR